MSTSSITIPRGARSRLLESRWAPLPIVLSGTFMVVLDFFIVNVALPSIQAGLHASSSAIEWIVAGYGLTSAVFLVTGGRLGDRIGRRRTFSLGLALFTASSTVCGLAPDPTMLVIARLVQGVAGALLMPNVMSIISVTYDGSDRVRALSAYGMVMGLAAVGGQLIGGVLVQANIAGLGWRRSCFLINVPIGLLALALAPRLVPESRAPQARRTDRTGTVLITAGLTAIVLPLVDGRAHGWHLQQGRGLSALDAGLVFTILAVSYLVASMQAPALATKHGRRVLAAGALTLASGHLLLIGGLAIIGVHGSIAWLVPGLVLVGAGMGLGITPLATIILSGVRPEQAGSASGALTTMQNVGSAIGVAVIGVIFFGSLHLGPAEAFQLSLAALAAILVGVTALTRLLPAPGRSS